RGRTGARGSTQEAFGRIMAELARDGGELSGRIVTASPDVTVSTSLGGWVNRRGVFSRHEAADVFRLENVVSAQKWALGGRGQHIELGIAEHNLFLTLAALGLAGPLFGRRLLPVGTVYDPFIARGLDALIYALYQDARFMLVATPSGITLAPEGGAHQSVTTPLIGMGLPGLASFEPAFVDELAEILRFGFEHMQAEEGGGSVYLRLSTRSIPQPQREPTPELRRDVIRGGYWLFEPSPEAELALVYAGAVAPEVMEAREALAEDLHGVGVLAVTSAERLHADWRRAQRARADGAGDAASHVERLLARTRPDCALITVQDGHPAALSWLGAAARRPTYPLGVSEFGQSGDIPDLYRRHRIDALAIVDAAALACRDALLRRRG
ncbi:MAG TPA: transketolase, partial [Geminicoccaceae bacterium]|nr:transketolase [Geminicoccaceae bacterium]